MDKNIPAACNRRRFLITGMSGAASLAVSVSAARSALAGFEEKGIPATVGYWEGSGGCGDVRVSQQDELLTLTQWGQGKTPSGSRLVDASSMIFGESGLRRRGARVSVAGARFPSGAAHERQGVDLVALFDSGADQPWKFLCWRGEAGRTGPRSSPLRFTVPLSGKGFRFCLETFGGTPPPSSANLALDTGWGWLKPKLRQGIYFVAGLRSFNRLPPRWSDYLLRALPSEGPVRQFRLEAKSGHELDFVCLTLVVGRA